ncbi:MAG: HAD family hydrolase [Methylophaga sp.]|nr:HAD family hydrolase [Methylophaga sp.]
MATIEARAKLYALDFDGVICDSAIETGITGWKVAHKIWPEMPAHPTEKIIDLFRQVRPVMETGYEAILIMRLLCEGISPTQLLTDFANQIDIIIKREQFSTTSLKQQFGETRDHWLTGNLDEWIEMNPLFDGVSDKLRQIEPEQCYIITTKQERFVSKILEANNISFPAARIFGLDRNMSKPQILADLIIKHQTQTILFVEDRLPTLINVIDDQQLNHVQLFFANWGYNTEQDKLDAAGQATITTIDLAGFMRL